jgi:ATP-binding protein involved in chromosome partitioning
MSDRRVLEAKLFEAVSSVVDPDLGLSLRELGAIHEIEVSHENVVSVYLFLVQPLHFAAERIHALCRQAIARVVPEAKVDIYVREADVEKALNNRAVPGVKNFVAVSSGKGGVGKSTVTANLAIALASAGMKVGIIDADVHGPSMPTMFGLQDQQLSATKREDGKVVGEPLEAHGIYIASIGFLMSRDQAAVMRGPMQAGYFSTLFEQIDWPELDVILFDLPPGTGDIHLTLTQKIPLTGAVVVTTPQEISLADVRRGISMFRKVNVPVLGIVENMSYFALPDGSREYIFGKDGGKGIAEELAVPFLGEIPIATVIREGGDRGRPAGLDDAGQADIFTALAANVASAMRTANRTAGAPPTIEISLPS